MKTHDELMALSDAEKLAYLQEESERLIQSAPGRYQLGLRAIQAKCNGIRSRTKDPLIACRMISDMMHRKFDEMRQALNGVGK